MYEATLAAIKADMKKLNEGFVPDMTKVVGKSVSFLPNASTKRRRKRITSTPQYELMGRVQGMTAVYV